MSEYIAHPTDENLRIKITLDECPSKPYNDGGFPIWRIEDNRYGQGHAVQESDLTSYVTPGALDDGLTGMLERDEHHDKPLLERYLRIFWGVTFVQWWNSGSYWYVTCDPAHWREHVGITDTEVARREEYTKHAFTEWQAWCEGDVWFAEEQRRFWQRTTTRTWNPEMAENPDDPESSDEIDEFTTDGYSWQDTDQSCGGFYGDVDDDLRRNMMWQFGWPEAACKRCGEGIVNDHAHGWVDADVPYDQRERYTTCVTGVMMHTRGPKHEPKEK